MSRTTPVRWWRDDATRYQSRPPYVSLYVGPRLDLPPLAPSVLVAMARLKKRCDDAVEYFLGPRDPT